MNKLNFENGDWWQLNFVIAWPHQRVMFGWDIMEPTDEERTAMVNIHLGFLCISYEWYKEEWFDED